MKKLFYVLMFPLLAMAQSVGDTPFVQEIHRPYPMSGDQSADVRTLVIDAQDRVWAGTASGICLLQADGSWDAMLPPEEAGPVYDSFRDTNNTLWFGTWNGIYKSQSGRLNKITGIIEPITAISENESGIHAWGPLSAFVITSSGVEQTEMQTSRDIREVMPDGNRGWWIATGVGLYHVRNNKTRLYQSESDLISAATAALERDENCILWVGGLGGVTRYRHNLRIGEFRPADGVPGIHVQCLRLAPDGRMWVGTEKGVSRYDGQAWSVRHSRRWLLDDNVRDIEFDSNGTAWIATAAGVSAIEQKRMTLADKANHFTRIMLDRHVRDPYIVEKVLLASPGDTSNWRPRDDDNDGQYTNMTMAMESYRYAATGDRAAQERARKAFQCMRFFQTVTNTPGFVARTVIPADWTPIGDPNREYSARQIAENLVDNPREKIVEQRWRPSADGKWLWKGDTSSDEITGHMYGYFIFYEFAADEQDKKEVSEHVCRIMDQLMADGYVLKDIDGTHTEWGVWAPERLNHDPDWAPERGINSVELLSYLKLAYHVSGDEKYQEAYLDLIHNHHYLENARTAKNFNPSMITHIDDELLALAYPCLLTCENDPAIRAVYMESFERWYSGIAHENSPFFNFTYAAFTGFDPHLDASMAYLRDVPLDLVRWRVDNTQREDVQLERYPELESVTTSRMLPPSEISFFRWDRNPLQAIQGDGGHTESDGHFWLLPYWMGRYYGIIK
ncbi:regulator [candidate division KSB1 bacterium]|nr:regulator [candidate division KSB1 bacterium]